MQTGLRSRLTMAAFCLSLLASYSISLADEIRVTTFNVKWYGLEKEKDGEIQEEHRDVYLREFIQTRLRSSDVIVFQEIVDPQRLQRNVVQRDYECQTYRRSGVHQHVVLCHRPNYRFVRAPGETNFELEEVAYSAGARPALHGVLVDRVTGKELLHIFGVHLKAYPDEVDRRLSQTETMAREISKRGSDIPVVILGDTNAYTSPKNGRKYDDKVLMDWIYEDYRTGLRRLDLRNLKTFRSGSYSNQFDQIWVDQGVEVKSRPYVEGACNYSRSGNKFRDIEFYNENISDHCPVSVTLNVK